MRLEQVAWDHPDSVTLRAAQRAEIEIRYGTPDSEPGIAPSASDITVFLVAYDEAGTAIGCGGFRALSDTEAEVKRMFVAASSRGSGASTAVLRRLEDIARERGLTRMLLETGDRQPDAVRFYTREGYVRVPNFGHYVGHAESLCFAREL